MSIKIYTKTGDDGTTGLFGGGRRPKNDARIAAYGDVDELNAFLGLTRVATNEHTVSIDTLIERLQTKLFTLGADLATPRENIKTEIEIPRIIESDVLWLESEIDRYESELEPLKRFVLPGGGELSARLHVARTVARRAERSLITLMQHEEIAGQALQFLNRLSDLLFVLARAANRREGVADVEWLP